MRDSRLDKMAQVIVHYSLDVKSGDLVWMMGDMEGMPLFEALYEKLIMAGAHVTNTFLPPDWDEIFFKHASIHQLQHTCPFTLQMAAQADKRIRLLAPSHTRSLSHVDPQRQAVHSKSKEPIMAQVMERSASGEMEWVVTLSPTRALAQEGEMGYFEYEDFVYRAAGLYEEDPVAYWRSFEAKQQLMVDYLQTKKELHFQTDQGTDLKVNIEGMLWKNSCGKRNYPDGEVFTGPKLDAEDGGVNGVVHYTYPAIWNNRAVEGIRLHFEKGRVVKATADTNEDYLNAVIGQDEGAPRMGEIAIGTNYNIQQFTKNILFDEKIGGTFHAALGMGYPETGNKNQSALHWDMICDLREGGTIHADGELISKNGRFVFPDWPKSYSHLN